MACVNTLHSFVLFGLERQKLSLRVSSSASGFRLGGGGGVQAGSGFRVQGLML